MVSLPIKEKRCGLFTGVRGTTASKNQADVHSVEAIGPRSGFCGFDRIRDHLGAKWQPWSAGFDRKRDGRRRPRCLSRGRQEHRSRRHLIRAWDAAGAIGVVKLEAPTIAEAIKRFFDGATARGLEDSIKDVPDRFVCSGAVVHPKLNRSWTYPEAR